jgi:hypothetical protein
LQGSNDLSEVLVVDVVYLGLAALLVALVIGLVAGCDALGARP